MTISQHAGTFAGLPVRPFDPRAKRKSGKPCVYRVGGMDFIQSEYGDGEYTFPELLDLFLTAHGGPDLTALVIGAWNYQDMCGGLGGRGAAEVVETLVANRKRMPDLKALFLGDITYEECEMSWIGHGDVAALLPALPRLEEFRIRGASTLSFGKLSHSQLRSFALESGGLPEPLLQEVLTARLPQLEHLELWLGTVGYGGIETVEPLAPLLSGKRFKQLKYLGLRNCAIADAVAKAVAAAPLLERLEVLDLSLGNLTDVGGESLLASPAVGRLKKLDLHHHYLSPLFVEQFEKLAVPVDLSEPAQPDIYTHNGATHVMRYILVSE
jgi:hypothetical protein